MSEKRSGSLMSRRQKQKQKQDQELENLQDAFLNKCHHISFRNSDYTDIGQFFIDYTYEIDQKVHLMILNELHFRGLSLDQICAFFPPNVMMIL